MDAQLLERKKDLENELRRIVDAIIKNYSPEKIILFGSLAKGVIRQWSDIDLVIIKRTGKRFTERIGEVIEISKPKMAVDFIVYTPEEFLSIKEKERFIIKEIVEKGRTIYEK